MHLKKNRRFGEIRARFYACCVLSALFYLHSQNIVYRDLKPENVMLTQNGFIKLIDFGLAIRIQTGKAVSTARCGTPHYIAPEIIEGKPFDCSADYWSFGIFLYELAVGITPFNSAASKDDLFEQILSQEIKLPGYLSQDLKSLLGLLLERDPNKRLCSKQAIMSHRWFKGVDWEHLEDMQAPRVPKLESPVDLKYSGQDFEHESCDGIEVTGEDHWEGISDSDE